MAFSSSSSSEISCSIWAHTTNTSLPSPAAYSLTFATYGLLFPSSTRSSSFTFAAKITGFAVRRLYSARNPSSSSSSGSKLFASLPSSRCAFRRSSISFSFLADLSLFASFATLEYLLSKISRSEKISSRLIVSISRIGSTLPSTWMIFVSSKHLTT